MSIDVHLSDTHAESINVNVEVNNKKSLSRWQSFVQNHPLLFTVIVGGCAVVIGGVVGHKTSCSNSNRKSNDRNKRCNNCCKDTHKGDNKLRSNP